MKKEMLNKIVKKMEDLLQKLPYDQTRLIRTSSCWSLVPKIADKIDKWENAYWYCRAALDRPEIIAEIEVVEYREKQSEKARKKALKIELKTWRKLARGARLMADEHKSSWQNGSDDSAISCRDYVTPKKALKTPYLVVDSANNEGLALIEIERERTYSRTSEWRPSTRTSCWLVGRNEAGSYFSHAIPANSARTVAGALKWIWKGATIIRRQGDIAVAAGRARAVELPWGHQIAKSDIATRAAVVTHATHPDMTAPGAGEYFVVARRSTAADSSSD